MVAIESIAVAANRCLRIAIVLFRPRYARHWAFRFLQGKEYAAPGRLEPYHLTV